MAYSTTITYKVGVDGRYREDYVMKTIKIFVVTLMCCMIFSNSAAANTLGQYEIPLAQATTPESATNACVASMYLNQTIIDPGEIFSYNRIVGERTPERFFIMAPIASTSKNTVYEYGGGICMTAGVLLQAVKDAGLQIVERHNHVTSVNYLPLGEDAAIYWGVQDLKFKNTLDRSVLIHISFANDSLKIEIRDVEENLGQFN